MMQSLCAWWNEVINPYEVIDRSVNLQENLQLNSYYPKAFLKIILVPEEQILINFQELENYILRGSFSPGWLDLHPSLITKAVKKRAPKHLQAFCICQILFLQFCVHVYNHMQNIKPDSLMRKSFYFCSEKLMSELEIYLSFTARFLRFLPVFKIVCPSRWGISRFILFRKLFWTILKIFCTRFSVLDYENDGGTVNKLLSQIELFEHYNEQFITQACEYMKDAKGLRVLGEVKQNFIQPLFNHIRIFPKISSRKLKKRTQWLLLLYKILETPISKKYEGFSFLKAHTKALYQRISWMYKKSQMRSQKSKSFFHLKKTIKSKTEQK